MSDVTFTPVAISLASYYNTASHKSNAVLLALSESQVEELPDWRDGKNQIRQVGPWGPSTNIILTLIGYHVIHNNHGIPACPATWVVS